MNEPSIDDIRASANNYFSKGDYDAALPLYDLAVELSQKRQLQSSSNDGNDDGDDDLSIHLCNQSACLFKMERFEEARNAASRAVLASKGHNPKAHFRLVKTQLALHDYPTAQQSIDNAFTSLPTMSLEMKSEFDKLQLHAKKLSKKGPPPPFDITSVISIATEHRKPSIKEFDLSEELGNGNFSQIVVATHKHTREVFALKIIEKKKAASLAKRQHPDVYKEIEMERRVLLERVPPHPLLVKLYHAFQDYNNLFFLMRLAEGGDLWSQIRWKNKMVGCHYGVIRTWAWELLEAVEHLHRHGIVHRDLKPENVLLSKTGHVILIDFNTAKDLEKTDLTGQEFVGTPDFMAPEAVMSGKEAGADYSSDLWTYGAVLYQMFTGMTPFAAGSPYLSFLRIRRGFFFRCGGIGDDDAWDLMTKLMQRQRDERLGAGTFNCEDVKEKRGRSYDVIKSHPFFRDGDPPVPMNKIPLPSLQDLALRSLVTMIQHDADNLDLPDPGDGSSKDLLRLNIAQRRCVMHILSQLKVLSVPRVYRRFFKTKAEAKLNKVREWSHDFVGLRKDLTPGKMMAEGEVMETMQFVHFVHPSFVTTGAGTVDDLKDMIRKINRIRPKMVVATGNFDASSRKLLAKINESIPTILADGTDFCEVWLNGGQGLILDIHKLISTPSKQNDETTDNIQTKWLNMQLEQCKTSEHSTFIFLNGHVKQLPKDICQHIARSKVSAVFGIAEENYQEEIKVEKEATVPHDSDKDEDSDSDVEDRDLARHTTFSGGNRILNQIDIDDEGKWTVKDLLSGS